MGRVPGQVGRDICPRVTKDCLWIERGQMWHIGMAGNNGSKVSFELGMMVLTLFTFLALILSLSLWRGRCCVCACGCASGCACVYACLHVFPSMPVWRSGKIMSLLVLSFHIVDTGE